MDNVKNILLLGISALSVYPSVAQESKNKNKQHPNILYIMSDDHAEAAISAYGSSISKLAPTPNIDRIANEGAQFLSNYCCNSLSGPSRAAVMTGKHSHANGYMKNGDVFDCSQTTLQGILQANNYQTALIGKWHLKVKPQNFDYWIMLNDQGEYYNPSFITENDTTVVQGYVTDLITDYTIDYLDHRDKDKPFFVMMHHKAPHRNWWPAEKYYHLYDDVDFPLPVNYFDDYNGRIAAGKQKMNIYKDMYEGHDLRMSVAPGSDSLRFDPWPHLFNRMTPEQRRRFNENYRPKNDAFYRLHLADSTDIAVWKYQRFLREYLATVASVDESVGKMLDYLQKNGLLENTIVVYTTDQSFYLGEHGWFDKRFMYEESMKMPLMIRYPKTIHAGTKIRQLTQNIDFAPTFLDMCGIPVPEDMQGISFKPLLEGKEVKDWRKSLYYHYYEFPGFHSVRKHFGVKTERYKLICFYKDNDWELYDLQNDPHEMNNIYGKPGTEKITAELKSELDRLQALYKVPENLKK
ncbi:MAG: sulfatase [Candidatus Azobacteroides sp.]|nr:sulfatase [Candidatus Azobacteroides sp.]